MFCAHCGNPIGPDQQRCSACGHEISAPATGVAVVAAVPQSTVAPSTSGKAIASLVLAFFSWILPIGIVAVVLGHVAHGEIERSDGRLKGTAMADAGFIMGRRGAAVGLLFILSFIVRPRWGAIAANQASAVGALRTLNTSETTYKSMYPGVGFTCSLSQLGTPSSGTVSSTVAGLIDPNLAKGVMNTYRFTLGRCTTKNGLAVGYQWLAIPETSPTEGSRRFFCTDESGVIKYSATSIDACVSDGNPL